MAYREVDMWQILEVLRRIGRGENVSSVAKATGRTRKTVRRYVRLAEAEGWPRGQSEPSESLAGAVWRASRPSPTDKTPGSGEAQLGPHTSQIRSWLEDGGDGRVRHCGFADARRTTVRAPRRLKGKKYMKAALVVIDEVGFQPMSRLEASLFFRLVSYRYERGSILITTNKSVKDWPEILAGDEVHGHRAPRSAAPPLPHAHDQGTAPIGFEISRRWRSDQEHSEFPGRRQSGFPFLPPWLDCPSP